MNIKFTKQLLLAIGLLTYISVNAQLTAPVTESFNSFTTPTGWTTTTALGHYWQFSGAPNNITCSGPGDHTGTSGSHFAWMDQSGSNFSNILEMDTIIISALTIPYLEFYYNMCDSGYTPPNITHVEAYDGVSSWNILKTITTSTNGWEKVGVALSSHTFNNRVLIRFRAESGGSQSDWLGDNCLDDISVKEGPSCPDLINLPVTALIDTAVTLTWVGNPNTSNYEVWLGPSGFPQGLQSTAGVRTFSSSASFLIDTLSENTCYDYYVRGICTPGDTGNWIGPFPFCTYCTHKLSGTYTINSALPTGGANFASFNEIGDVLTMCGVSGPVTINVMSASNIGHMHLIDVPLVSAANSITINGNGNMVTYDGISHKGTFIIDNTGHLIIDNLIIVNNNITEGWGVYITGNSDSISITNCVFEVDSFLALYDDVIPLVVSGSTFYENDQELGADVDYLTIVGNDFNGGHVCMSLYGKNTGEKSSSYLIKNNSMRNFYEAGIYMNWIQNIDLIGNTVKSTVSNYAESGFYLWDVWEYNIQSNDISVKGAGIYVRNGNKGYITPTNSNIVNNMILSESDGLYLNGCSLTDIYHNTVDGHPALHLYSQDTMDMDIRNNILSSSNDFAVKIWGTGVNTVDFDFNLYFSQNVNPFQVGFNTVPNLINWRLNDPTINANSIEGDPVFVYHNDLHVIGNLANENGDNTLGVAFDIDGEARPSSGATVVDIGADEFMSVSKDIRLMNVAFSKEDPCLTTNDTISVRIKNLLGPTINFVVNPLSIHYDVIGPVSTNGSVIVNSGMLNLNNNLEVLIPGIDMSIPGSYSLDLWLGTNAVNMAGINDSIFGVSFGVEKILEVDPKAVLVTNTTDMVDISANSALFSDGDFFISEVAHWKYATGAPTGGWPAYLIADDYIEITGVPNSDLAGYTLEQWGLSNLNSSFTFKLGTLIGPNGTCIIMTGQDAIGDIRSSFCYNGTGGATTVYYSYNSAGRIIRDPKGNIVDAVAYSGLSGYFFPFAAGVSPADWSGIQPTGGSTSGIRLEGPDSNSAAGWVTSATSPQDPNTLNQNIPLPKVATIPSFQWTLNAVQVTTDNKFQAGPWQSSGTHNYIASLMSCGTTFYDTTVVTVIIPTCPKPSSITATSIFSSAARATFDTTGYGSSATFVVEYGPRGFIVGSGTKIAVKNNNTVALSGLPHNLCQDLYLRVVCAPGDTSFAQGPIDLCPEISNCDDMNTYDTGNKFNQSALFLPWQNGGASLWGDAEFTTAQAVSAPNSLRITDQGTTGATNIVALFEPVISGASEIAFDVYIPANAGGYFNIQQNHALSGVGMLQNAEIYFQGNGTASVQYSSGGVTVGTFSYAQGIWNSISTIIDLTNDTIWFELNGISTGLGYKYSSPNSGAALQFNGVNFNSGVAAGQNYSSDMYIDNFCVSPFSATGCPDPIGLAVNVLDCNSVDASWNSGSSSTSTDIEWGTAGFTPGSGNRLTSVSNVAHVTGLTSSTSYDVYIRDVCGSGATAWVGPLTFDSGTLGVAVASMATPIVGAATTTVQNVSFDASGSSGIGNTFTWDFGDGSTGSGVTTNHNYNTSSSYTVTLTVANNCSADSTTEMIITSGIDLNENVIASSLELYPNPAKTTLNIRFTGLASSHATVSVLDLTGKTIRVIDLDHDTVEGQFSGKLNIKRLARGTYMLKFENGGIIVHRRFVKH